MSDSSRLDEIKTWTWDLVVRAGVPLQSHERDQIEVTDLGLGNRERTGLQILTLAADPWLAAKLLVLMPGQFFPQHRHPPGADGYPGKTELFRGQFGTAYLYIPGPDAENPLASPPEERRPCCTVWNEVVLTPGRQQICPPNTWHWFQAGDKGAVIWSISSKATDAIDEFCDPDVIRLSPGTSPEGG